MKTIFIADDNNTDRMILESALKKLGYEVVSFSTGTSIHEAIRSAGKPIIALLDWLMPDRNGVDICPDNVRDNGPGIPIDTQEKIFTPFFTTKPIGKGTGLGLSISRNIIKDHKGELLVENNPNGGAHFKVLLPSKQKVNL